MTEFLLMHSRHTTSTCTGTICTFSSVDLFHCAQVWTSVFWHSSFLIGRWRLEALGPFALSQLSRSHPGFHVTSCSTGDRAQSAGLGLRSPHLGDHPFHLGTLFIWESETFSDQKAAAHAGLLCLCAAPCFDPCRILFSSQECLLGSKSLICSAVCR